MDTAQPTKHKTSRSLSNKAILWLAIIITCIGPFASDCYLPSLPSMTLAFSSTTNVMQLTVTLYLLGFSLSQLVYGPLSDRFGRRIIVLTGLGICSLSSLLSAFAPTASFLLLARLVQGIGAGVTNSIFRAVMRDIFDGPQLAKLGSYVGVVFAVAPALAPIIGGYLHDLFGWRSSFIFLFFLIGAAWMTLWFYLPETNKQLNPHAAQFKHIIKNYIALLSNKNFIGFVLCSSLAYAGILSYYTVSPFLLQNVLHLTPVQYGWSAIFATVSAIVGQFLNSFLVSHLPMMRVMLLGMLGMFLSGLIMLLIGLAGYLNLTVVILPTGLFIAFTCMIFANANAGALHPFAHMAGAASALYGCLQVFGSFVGTLTIANLHSNSQLPLAGIFIFLGLAAIAIFFLLIKPKWS